jgi:hypothetical protein
MTALLLLAAFLVAYAGFAYIALAMEEHWERLGHDPHELEEVRPWLRAAGAFLLLLAYLLCFWFDGPAFGSLLWGVLISVAAIAVAFTLTWWPQRKCAAGSALTRAPNQVPHPG